MKENQQASYFGPFLTMVFLFLIVGFLTTANGQFQGPLKAAFLSEAGSLKNTFATLVTFSWFLAYPVCGGIGAKWVNSSGYKTTLIRGLLVMVAGLLLFFLSSWCTVQFPGARVGNIPTGFFIFLLGSFVVGAAVTVLQVVINPYLTACHVKGTQAVQRISIAGTASSVGTTVAPYFVSGIVFGSVAMEDVQVSQLMAPFLVLTAVVAVVAFVMTRLSLPDIQGIRQETGETLEKSVWSFRHLTLGVVAIFCYVGCEVCIGTNINLYVMEDLGLDIAAATLMATLYWGGLLVGRLLASTISTISPRTQLTFTTIAASLLVVVAMMVNNPWVLVAVGLFHSIMWGAIFTLSVAQLGKYTSAASGVIMIGVVGGAILPLLQGVLADWLDGWRFSWGLVLIGELFMLFYALVGSRVKTAATVLLLSVGLGVSAASTRVTVLDDGWQCQSSAVTDGSWYAATVPSTVMGVLTTNGEYPRVLEEMNYKTIDPHRFDVPWVYRKDFDLEHLDRQEHVTLRFEGISYSADIWLNDQLVASHDTICGPFRVFEFDVTPFVREHNTLRVVVHRAQPGDPNIGFVDWNPRPADESMGIVRPVSVKRTGAVCISNPCVKTQVQLQTLDEAWLTVEADVRNLSDEECSGTLTGTLESGSFAVPYTLKPREQRTLRISAADAPALHIVNPRLWWCHTLGSPELYSLHLCAGSDAQVSDETTVSFGIREVGSFITTEGYRAFTLNGQRILLTGAGWTDDIFLRDTPERYDRQLQMVRDMNLNTIRLEGFWGTSQALYDLCDRMGILILAGWSCHWEWPEYLGKPVDERYGGIVSTEDVRLIADSYDDQLRLLRNHPSIVAWFVGSDRLPVPALEQHYEWTRKVIDDRPIISSAKEMESDLTGTSGTKMAGPYEYVAPAYWYSSEAPGGAFGFNTETGIGAQLPVKESVEQMLGKNRWPLDSVWDYHCTAAASAFNSMQTLSETIAARYGEAKSLDDFLRKAYMVNYDGTRAMFEAFRYNFPRATGIVQWMLNGARPGLYWQLYDHYLRPTSAFYSVKKACQPIQLIYNYGTREVRAVNSTLATVGIKARMRVYGISGRLLHQQDTTLTVGANGHADVFKVELTEPNGFLFLYTESDDGRPLADNVYALTTDTDTFDWQNTEWTHTPALRHADHKAIGTMRADGCRVKETHRTENGKTMVTLEVSNPTDRVAHFLRLSLRSPKGQLIDGVRFSDNYITLEPHATRTVTCEFAGQQKFKAVITED